MTNSAIYVGEVRHRRHEPVAHAFRYRMFTPYLDLDELPEILDRCRFWSARRWAPAYFKRSDFHGNPVESLAESVRKTVAGTQSHYATRSIRMLGHLRYFGHCFNPVVFYFCFGEESASRPHTVLAEITNTPWKERHTYAVTAESNDPTIYARFQKAFHVSPFMDMNHEYEWTVSAPSDQLTIAMRNIQNRRCVFDATLVLHRRELTPAALDLMLLKYPFMTLRIVAAIYYQAARLWWRKAPFFPHPATTPNPESATR